MQLKLSGKRWSKDFYVYIHKLFEWVRVLCKSFKHNKYLWLSQILTQLKDHLPTGVSPRCWRKVHHQCVLLFRHLCRVYIRFPSWDGNANNIPSLLCSQVLSFTFLVVEKRDKAGRKGDPGNEFNGFSVSLRCFSILPRNSQLSNMHLFKLLFASYMVKQTVITIFVKSLLK